MERLPYIDEHDISINANRTDTWSALSRLWGNDARRPFFRVDEATPTQRLALKGRHPFSIYKLVFELDDDGPTRTRLSALTFADFPGLHGRVYRALVIGTGGHRIAVRQILRRIAAEVRARGMAA